jgi:hypothetical protein
LGYEVGESAPASRGVPEEVRREVLSQLRAGQLSADEALQILRGDGE